MFKSSGKVFIFFGIFFVVLGIVVPCLLILFTPRVHCGVPDDNEETIVPGGQAVCTTDFDEYWTKKRWNIEYGDNGENLLNVYDVKDFFDLPTVNRTYVSPSISVTLKGKDYYYFGFTAGPTYASIKMNCSNEDVQTLFAEKREFVAAGGKKGHFDGSLIKGKKYRTLDKCLAPGEVFKTECYSASYFYLVVANPKSTSVSVDFQFNLTFNVFDLSNQTPTKSKQFPRIYQPEALFIDYPITGNGLDSVDIDIYDIVIDWVAVGAVGGVLLLVGVVVLIVGIVVLKKGREPNYAPINSSNQSTPAQTSYGTETSA